MTDMAAFDKKRDFVPLAVFSILWCWVSSEQAHELKRLHQLMNPEELQNIFHVGCRNRVPDYNVTFLKVPLSNDSYEFEVAGQSYRFQLHRNDRLISPHLRVIRATENQDKLLAPTANNCHYIGYSGTSVAALSKCGQEPGLEGMLYLPDSAVVIKPVPLRLRGALKGDGGEEDGEEIPHILSIHPRTRKSGLDDRWLTGQRPKRGGGEKFLEFAVFFDEAAYQRFLPVVRSEAKLQDLILGFVNQIQALYYQPELQEKMHITLVHLEIHNKQPRDLRHYDGERNQYLDSFCEYQARKNPGTDADPGHWDMALYLTGLNLYAMENGQKNQVTMGLAPVGGVCLKKHACVISEFGTVNDLGKPYPSAGLMATYVAAHEMGHNLGMLHDGLPNNACPSNGYVMSPSRGTKGETTWSSCSADVMRSLRKPCLQDKPAGSNDKSKDHGKFGNLPGQEWDAYDQCRVFMKDEDAILYNSTVLEMVCEQTLCRSPHKMGYYAAGPALDGTFCSPGKWCRSGRCVTWNAGEAPEVRAGGWSNWQQGKCQSGCLKDAHGAQTDKRKCDNPKPKNTNEICEGESLRVIFCDDTTLCPSRTSTELYATDKCLYFAKYVRDVTEKGTQVPHSDSKPWQACAVYCKLRTGAWYTPVQEVGDLNVDPYFPDGTKCHSNAGKTFYCQNHQCKPAVQGRSLNAKAQMPPGILGNAPLNRIGSFFDRLREYFRYVKGAQQTGPPPKILLEPKDDDDNDIDYILL